MSNSISIDQLGEVISEELTLYAQNVRDGIDQVGEKHIKRLVQNTKATAPVGKRNKHYRDSIKFKKIKLRKNTRFVWYVDGPNYRLSHLLENGHALRNGGRVEGTHFIQKATDPILEEYEKDVEEVIRNG